jgi:proteasome beta subunit
MNQLPDWSKAAFGFDPNPSFADLLRRAAPEPAPPQPAPSDKERPPLSVPHATTVLALRFADGVVVAGDRRALEGMTIADRRIEKVFAADDYSAVAIAGAAGQAMEIVKLFQTELEHYEKVEGERLSLDGKANRLAQMIRQNFGMALQGLVVVPLFAGYDRSRGAGRIFRYDAIGGRYEELEGFHATGSGGTYARGTLKKRYRPDLDRGEAVRAAVEALIDASEEDAATGGPDVARNIYPNVAVIAADGYREVLVDELKPVVEALLEERGA